MAGCVGLCVVLLHLSGVLQASALECGWGNKPCRDGSDCVPTQHVCDGEYDCKDGSDEEDCPTCSEDQFQCVQGRRCIQKAQVCDGELHCRDGSDEADCPSEFCSHRCSIGSRCLPASMVCDGEADCPEGSDEEGCGSQDLGEVPSALPAVPSALPAVPSAPPAVPSAPPAVPSAPPAVPSAPPAVPSALPAVPRALHPAPVAPPSEPVRCPFSHMCRNGVECIPRDHVCDGQADCSDSSDEDECALSCGPGQFQCAHGRKCIPQIEVCDGEYQCQDRSDEANCQEKADSCSHYCDEGSRCVPKSFLCDGDRDCLDGSDEAHCEGKGCGATEFQCFSGECVKASMHCDGHPDCNDQSDEEGCSNPVVCPTKLRCEHSKECLVPEWLCDGQRDCTDGSDEKNCSVARLDCADFQWSCKSRTQCLSARWRCDGFIDCEDVSDEVNCGLQPCAPHLVRCSSQECVDVSLMCNGVRNCVDGSDEGAGCMTSCSEADHVRCSQTCYSTPQGPRCACAAGFRLQEDGTTCEDVDECASVTVCGQLCVNSLGSYHCACQLGYTMEPGGHHCKVSGDPYLLTSVQTDLLLLNLRSKALEELPSSAQKAILSVDYDWKEQKVYWVTVDTDSINWSSLDQKSTGMLIRGVRADSVAVDWLGRNLYWIDGERSQIIAIPLSTSANYSIILDENLDQPRSLALMPQKGLLFWTEIGNVVKIERAGMDGSDHQVVVNSSLGWPGAVTVDTVSNRIYWTDERLKAIGSATLDGNELQILQIKETANPFSLAVFNENLFWSDAKRRVVLSAQKSSGKNPHVLLKRLRQPFAVKIIHPVLQMGPEELCEGKACSHMCVLAPGPVAVCRCPAGLLLADDGLTCSSQGDSAFLLMLSSSTVTQIFLQSRHSAGELKGWPEHLVLQVPSIDDAAIIDYSVRNHTLFLTDDGRSSLSSFRLKDSDLVPQGRIFKLQNDTISAIALDWVTYNIYWSSKKQPGLQVTSITAVHTAVLLKVGLKRLESLALHPPTGSLCFSNLDQPGSSAVECSSMDGSKRRVVWKDVVHATSLVFSGDGGTVYWADTGLGSIGSVQVDGSGFRDMKVEGVSAVALSDDTLLWMTSGEKSQLWFRDEQQQSRLWFDVDSQVVVLKAFSRSTQSGSNQCAEDNGGCQQLCLATPQGRSCMCAQDHMPLNTTHCQPEQRCPEGSRSCLDQLSCQPANKFCDGHVDCPDHSDENCVTVKTPSGALASPPATATTAPPTTPTQVSHLDTTLEISSQLDLMDLAECSKRRCSGRGRCMQGGCECSFAYTGDSCDKHLLQNLQGPVMYGTVAVCTGVLLLIVVLVVLKKRRIPNSGSNSAVATTESRMMMQDRTETQEVKCPSSVVGGEVDALTLNTTTS